MSSKSKISQIDRARFISKDIQSMYEKGLSVWKISDKTNISGQTIYKHLKEIGTTFRSRSESIRRHSLNHNIFEEINSHAKAYWLGMLFSDGGITYDKGTHTVSLTLHREDRYHIESFKKFLGSSVNIIDRKDKLASSICVAGKHFCDTLIDKGMIPRKSLILGPPNKLPEEYINSFILGVFDGDGCLHNKIKKRYNTHQSTVSIVGSYKLMYYLNEKISEHTGVKLRKLKKAHNSDIFNIRYEGRIIVKKVLDWMYKDSPFFLKRKKRLYIKYVVKNKTLKNKINKLKTVIQKDLSGNFIREWESGMSASRTLGIYPSGIYNCCNGRCDQSSGYIWEFKGE